MLKVSDINYFFNIFKRHLNNHSNKIRENIITEIVNKTVPKKFYKNEKWTKIDNEVNNFISLVNDNRYDKITCSKKAGRNFNYDFHFNCYNQGLLIEQIPVEFKYNSNNINYLPQFYSPSNPSKYFNNSYEEFYYNNYFLKLIKLVDNYDPPSEEIYCKFINQPSPDFCDVLKIKYKTNKNFKKIANQYANESIKLFINNNEFNHNKMIDDILLSQNDKIYMLYKDEKFYLKKNDLSNLQIKNIEKTNNSIIIYTNKINLKVLLRWKNNNGIAFPAFQISYITDKKITKKYLIEKANLLGLSSYINTKTKFNEIIKLISFHINKDINVNMSKIDFDKILEEYYLIQ